MTLWCEYKPTITVMDFLDAGACIDGVVDEMAERDFILVIDTARVAKRRTRFLGYRVRVRVRVRVRGGRVRVRVGYGSGRVGYGYGSGPGTGTGTGPGTGTGTGPGTGPGTGTGPGMGTGPGRDGYGSGYGRVRVRVRGWVRGRGFIRRMICVHGGLRHQSVSFRRRWHSGPASGPPAATGPRQNPRKKASCSLRVIRHGSRTVSGIFGDFRCTRTRTNRSDTMKKREKLTDRQIEDAASTVPWYGICRTRRVRLDDGTTAWELDGKTFCCLGPSLLADFIAENREMPFPAGLWIVGAWIPRRTSSARLGYADGTGA